MARNILLKPIQSDVGVISHKMDALVYNCVVLGGAEDVSGKPNLAHSADAQILNDLLLQINKTLDAELLSGRKN